jgi:oxygen-independent coproporphyrinogen-3 oxidase
MSGIYIHFPFCLKKCYYCDFYTVIGTENKEKYIRSLQNEIKIRKNYLNFDGIDTIYLGGGTPGLLTRHEINAIFNEIIKFHTLTKTAEITIELNPEDVTNRYVDGLRETNVNRISLGIQSFFDDDLKLMNRRHNTEKTEEAIRLLKSGGYKNISGDLIYGLPNTTLRKWKENLKLFFDRGLVHLSAYHITYEAGTVFHKFIKTGKLKELDEELSREMFEVLIEIAEKNGFVHYETSNFGKEGFFSMHNLSYWQQKHYMGLGTSAHSFDGTSRQFNISNIKDYMNAVAQGEVFFEKEILSEKDRYNDYLITSLRTLWGTDTKYIKEHIGAKFYEYLSDKISLQIREGFIRKEKENMVLTKKGKFIENTIIESLFYI